MAAQMPPDALEDLMFAVVNGPQDNDGGQVRMPGGMDMEDDVGDVPDHPPRHAPVPVPDLDSDGEAEEVAEDDEDEEEADVAVRLLCSSRGLSLTALCSRSL